MQLSEFIEATSRLETYYDKDYTNEQRQIMFEELQEMDIDRYKKLVSVVIRKNKFLPKVADIFEADKEEPYSQKQEEKEKIDCNKCKGLGVIVYKKKISNGLKMLEYEYAAICDCENEKIYKGWEISDKEHRSNFFTPTVNELGLEV